MPWDFDREGPIYLQLVAHIERSILSGEFPPGERCPSVRELACIAAVNPNTMQKALQELERMGLVVNNRTSGRTITDDEQLLANTKKELAIEQLQTFVAAMKGLGYTKEDCKTFIMKELN